MKKNHLFKSVVAVVLCAAMLLSIALGVAILMPVALVQAAVAQGDNFAFKYFEGLNFSLLGDSISTYDGVSNNASYNSTIGGNAAYYGATGRDDWATSIEPLNVSRGDTWWQQAVDTLGMNLCVNNSWSGSYIRNGANANSGCVSRCRQLHNTAGTKPDIIALYMGTNDCNSNTDVSTLGTPNDGMYNKVATELNNTSFAPGTILGAYSLMIARAKDSYPNAEIYCFTLLPKIYCGSEANCDVYQAFNAGLKEIAAHYGVYVVDLFEECGLHNEELYKEYCLSTDPINSLHPNPWGMDAITNCFISTLMKNSKYVTDTVYDVSYDLSNVYVKVGNVENGKTMFGDVTAAVAGNPFRVELGTAGLANIQISVKMGGVDITKDAVRGDVVSIENVTGDVVITAYEFDNFHWEAKERALFSNPNLEATFSYNDAALISGTYGANGVFDYATAPQFELKEPAMLLHDKPWVMEFRITGVGPADEPTAGFKGGILLTSDTANGKVDGNTYLHINQSSVLLGHRDSGFNNTGYDFTEIAAKLGSTSGQAMRNEPHTYRLVNRINADGSNMVYLYVDGIEIGPMNGGRTNVSTISGRDYMIHYLGSSDYPLRACQLHYMKIFENGEGAVTDSVDNFRWDGVGESLTTRPTDDYFTQNIATIEKGTGVNGVHPTASFYSLGEPITLLHNRNWTIEWKAKGSWGAGSGEDPMLFATVNKRAALNGVYLWRNSSDMVVFGHSVGTHYDNYGVNLAPLGLNDAAYYTYRLENVVEYDANGSYARNMVYLYIDDVLIGAMDDHFKGSAAVAGDTENNWISGKDFVFSYLGTEAYPISDVTFEYIQVWENGGKVNTARLQYFIENRLPNSSLYDAASWQAYNAAVEAGITLLKDVTVNQAKVDEATERILFTRNQIVGTESGAAVIYSVELVTGEYARVGKQTGLKIVTSSNVAQVCVGTQTLLTNSGRIQTLDGKQVKVWLVTFNGSSTTESTVTYGIGAWTAYDRVHTGNSADNPDAYSTIDVKYVSRYVVSLSLTKQPQKTVYFTDDQFDPTGMEVTALMNDGTTKVVTDYFIEEQKLYADTTSVTVNYQGATISIPVTVYTSVEATHWYVYDGTIKLLGVYIGIADEGLNSDKEILLKDANTNAVIAIRTPDFETVKDQYTIGSMLVVTGTQMTDSNSNTPGKRYLQATGFEAYSGSGSTSFDTTWAKTATDWAGMQSLFNVDTLRPYTLVALTGTMYLHYYAGSDTGNYRIHMNGEGTADSDIRPDGTRALCLRGNVMEHNLGADWLSELFGVENVTDYPGACVEGTVYAIYTGANSSDLQLTVLDPSWIDVEPVA